MYHASLLLKQRDDAYTFYTNVHDVNVNTLDVTSELS